MKNVVAVAGAIAVVLAIVFLIGRRNCGSDKHTTSAHTGSAAIGKTTSAMPASQRKLEVPTWLSQLDVKPHKIAGHVVFDGKPVEGAIVRLALDARNAVYQPVAQTKSAADGSFDFGPQPGARFNVTAEAPDRTPAQLSLEVADPKAKPDQLMLVLGACASRLYGSVLDASGGAIANAHVRTAGIAGTESDAKGEYSACMSGRQAEVRVEADGYGTIMVVVQLAGELRYDFVLVPEAVLVGQVVTEDKSPVANARVIALPDPSEWPHHIANGWAMTDDDGRFRIPGASPGHYRLTAAAEGLASNAPVDVIVKPGTMENDAIIVVSARARVNGHVVMADQPVAGAQVIASLGGGEANGLGSRSSEPAFSQADGSFVLQGVPLGTVAFNARPYDVTAPKRLEIKTMKVDNVKLEVAALASIHGVVTRKGQPVPDAELQGPGVPEPVRGNADGEYRIEGLMPGEVRFIAWSVDQKAFAMEKVVKVAAGDDKRVDIELDCAGRVRGTVVDESATPVPGVYVRLESDDGKGDFGESMTDAKGRFDAGSMAGGAYLVSVYPSPMAGQPFEPATGDRFIIKVPRDGVVDDAKLAIKNDRFAISGTVMDDAGGPVADVHVEAIGRGKGGMDLPSIMSTADGTFTIKNLARGTYNLHAHGNDGSEGDTLNVVAGSNGAVVKLVRPGSLEGTLVGFTNTPFVRLQTLTTDLQIGSIPIVEGTRFWQVGLRPGTYAIEAKAPNEVDGASIEIKSGQTTKVTLTSRGVGKLEGRLLEYATKAPVGGFRCDANLSMGGQMGGPPPDPSQMSFPDDKGHFAMSAPVGTVRVFCFSQGDPSLSPAGADVDVIKGAVPSVEVYTVRNKSGASHGNAGFRIRPAVLPLVVNSVEPKTAAEQQGMKVGDTIVSIDGLPVQGLLPAGAGALIGNHKPGSIVTVGVTRGGTPVTFKIPVTASAD